MRVAPDGVKDYRLRVAPPFFEAETLAASAKPQIEVRWQCLAQASGLTRRLK